MDRLKEEGYDNHRPSSNKLEMFKGNITAMFPLLSFLDYK